METDEIYFNYPAIGDIVADLEAERCLFNDIRTEVDGIVTRLNTVFIAQAQTTFAELHTAFQPDFDRYDDILGVLSQVVEESAEYNMAADAQAAQKIHEIMTKVRIFK